MSEKQLLSMMAYINLYGYLRGQFHFGMCPPGVIVYSVGPSNLLVAKDQLQVIYKLTVKRRKAQILAASAERKLDEAIGEMEEYLGAIHDSFLVETEIKLEG